MAGSDLDDERTLHGTFRVPTPAPIPEVLDVLVAGGGPGGTAAAVRARELGLSCLVVDYDDLMKRIRDYPKEKLIKPGFGGGDKLEFPKGGAMLAQLEFGDIDKDDMVRAWKGLYRDFDLTARVGSELTGLTAEGDLWEVRTWNHHKGDQVSYRARNVVIAIGAGVPRRFDIPGNTEGIAFRLDDPAKYAEGNTLVIGGGTSAAEAVIAISQAKVDADDPTSVYWSYRGAKMPKVSQALSEAFFQAFVVHGNVRHLAWSEPVAVVPGADKADHLSVRVDRKVIEGRPTETVHLEFRKDRVVACIGEDLPIAFLRECGFVIPMVNDKPRMLVNPHGEVSAPGVFLVGDARGRDFLRCTDFDDESTWEKVMQRRNIKASMVEAVQAVDEIGRRLGKDVAAAEVASRPRPTRPVPPVAEPDDAVADRGKSAAEPAASGAKAADAGAAAPASGVHLSSLLPEGTVDSVFVTEEAEIRLGRQGTTLDFPNDVHMADHHATLRKTADGWTVEDTGAGSGIWIRIPRGREERLGRGDTLWVGTQLLMLQGASGAWEVGHYDGQGELQRSYPLAGASLLFGRSAQVSIAPGDSRLSRRHVQVAERGDAVTVSDLSSKNGTFLRVIERRTLRSGDELRIANQFLRFELPGGDAHLDAEDRVSHDAPATGPSGTAASAAGAQTPPAAPAPSGAGGAISIEHDDYPVELTAQAGQDLLTAHIAGLEGRGEDPDDHQAQPIEWDCAKGYCGACIVEVVSGAENLEPPHVAQEMKTIANVNGKEADPTRYRLLCCARASGPVVLRAIDP